MTELQNLPETKNAEVASSQPAPARPVMMRRLVWIGAFFLVLVVAGLVGWWYLPPTLHGIQLQSPRVADDFTLPTSTGQKMSLSDLRGKYVVLFFGYTYCPD